MVWRTESPAKTGVSNSTATVGTVEFKEPLLKMPRGPPEESRRRGEGYGAMKNARPSPDDEVFEELRMMKEKWVVKSDIALVRASHRSSGSRYTALPTL
ncbi:hypothetical protein C4D60_Mb08t03100 [Musa balbisiana]|uniref:Uncharacterized protein n=1 Tax=Musa balbisiana TaxID=52838 RepID=A0A4S8K0Y5_MUSBA|nr:hypothetical protein C4D60_Mb08t03100 [Musa balbisiana]